VIRATTPRNGLFAVRGIVVNQCQLLAFELVKSTFFFGNGLHQHVSSQPVRARQWEVPFEDRAVLAFTAAIAGSDQGDFVQGGFFSQCKRDAGGQRLKHRGTAVFALQAFVALHTTVGGVAGFTFFINDLDAVDAATRVGELEVIGIAVGPWHTVGGVGTGAVGQARKKLFFGLGKRRSAHRGHESR